MFNTKDILSNYKRIALVGASKDLKKTSSIVMKYLQDYGFKVYPVNPSMKGEKILGEEVFGRISEIKDQVEIIDVFRPSNEATEIAKEAVKVGAKVLWLQLDIKNEEARRIVEANNIIYIEDKCTKIEFEKYLLQDWVSDKCMDTLQNDTKPCELSVIDKRPKPINKLPKNGLVDRDIDGHPCTSKIQINPLVQVNTTMLNNTIEELNNVSPLKIRKKSVYERHLIPLLQIRQSINNKRFPMNLLQLYQESQNGRISPMKNLDFPHLINIPPNVRLVMFSDMGYYDYDMSNSHLSIFNELCKKYDFIPQGIEEYINNKRYHRERWSYDFCIKEKVIKEYIISWLYGNGMNPIIHNPFYKDLGYERMMKIKDDDLLNTIYQDIIKGRRIVIENQQIVDNHYVNIMDKRYPTKKTKGQILCFFLFGYESKILEIVNDVIGDDMKVMIYDGWIGKKTDIKYLESEVKNRLGIGIKFDEELIERPPIQKMY